MVEGACDNSDLAMLNFFITHSPSPSFVGSSLPEGAFVTASDHKTEDSAFSPQKQKNISASFEAEMFLNV